MACDKVWCVTKLMVCDKVMWEKWCVTKWCERWCVKDGASRMICDKLWCVKDEVKDDV